MSVCNCTGACRRTGSCGGPPYSAPTPTPPDAVREARIREALVNALDEVSLEGMNHLAIALGHEGHSRFASWGFFVSSLTDALLTRPSDARGREVTEYAIRRKSDGSIRKVFGHEDAETRADWLADVGRKYEQVQRTVITTEWTPLSPTQEGAK